MYGLDPATNLDFLNGKTLVQVCVGLNEVILNFEPGLKITVLSKLSFALPATPFQRPSDHREAAKILVYFLDDTIVSAEVGPNGTITVLFQGGGRIKLTEDSKQFEAYVIDNCGRLTVV